MKTENKYENKPKETDVVSKPNSNEGMDENNPTKKIKRKATQEQLDHPLHGIKLVEILDSVVKEYGWKYLADEVNILCFKHNPTMKVSLKFLRKFKWAREHVEDIYMDLMDERKKLKGKQTDNLE